MLRELLFQRTRRGLRWLAPVAVVLFALALYWYGGMTVLDDMMHVAIWQNAAQAGSK